MFAYAYLFLVLLWVVLIGVGIWLAYSHRHETTWWFYGPIVGAGFCVFLLVFTLMEWRTYSHKQYQRSETLCMELQNAKQKYVQSKDVNQWARDLDGWMAQRRIDTMDGQIDVDALENCFVNEMNFVVDVNPESHALSPSSK